MAEETGKPGPTPSEAIFFFNIVQHMKNKGDIDWDAVAVSTGFKNAGVAKVRPSSSPSTPPATTSLTSTPQLKVRFGQIKRKYGLDGESPAKSPAKKNGRADVPSTPTKEAEEEDPDDDEEEETAKLIKEEIEPPFPFGAQKDEAGEDDDDWAEVKNEHPKDEDGFTYF
ncbi:hypothetical protein NLG97_g4629 [Lecanicillium saksenae]|uniref:Uncharacterized protein n=1 Tax=Lecanicillium saksenae TaxID=468837 RepID=A0ACC1QUR3_9HYPO|nr:hypothetical protein NLG97_g4629 [Lecanicillium saksenae]